MFEFAGEEALVDKFQPAVFPLDRADFVVGDGFGSRGAHGRGVYSHSRDGKNPGVIPAKAGIQVLNGIARIARELKI